MDYVAGICERWTFDCPMVLPRLKVVESETETQGQRERERERKRERVGEEGGRQSSIYEGEGGRYTQKH